MSNTMEECSQVSVRLITSLGKEYRVPATQMAVPSNVTRYGLSTIINHMLQLDPPRVFDILLDGELLRQSLGTALLAKKVSTEESVALEYTFLSPPPQLAKDIPQEDWVHAIACVPRRFICCGTAAGSLVVHSSSGAVLNSVAAHPGGLTALATPPPAPPGHPEAGRQPVVFSAGQCGTTCVWRLQDDGPKALLRLEGHTDTVAALDATETTLATGGWDGQVHLWHWARLVDNATVEGAGGPAENKRAKLLGQNSAATGAAVPVISESAAQFSGHTQEVCGVAWASRSHFFTASRDHTLRRWDVATGAAVDSIPTGKALFCCTCGHKELGTDAVVASGAVDGTLRWWDCRSTARRADVLALKVVKGHSAPVSSVSWRPESQFQVAAASYDGLLRLWDMRSSIPLATLEEAGAQRLFAAEWGSRETGAQVVATGGADSVLRVYDAAEAGVRVHDGGAEQ